ncbi:heterokaryon incompatibility protein-domain-containing protein [Rhexocercosporidium sp. MPI-PUGE-AT-0058]|nr:heterokaryon incompatibility protein-domain-containing protein [Rhexocercosporidium sp. MPI-PUGE-AT-0058]
MHICTSVQYSLNFCTYIQNGRFCPNGIGTMVPPHDGRIPHTCPYCQEELIDLKSTTYDYDEKGKYHTNFKFKASASEAQEAAANGCAFWEWFIRDYLDDDGKRKGQGREAGVYFEFTFTDYDHKTGYQQYPFPLKRVYASRHEKNGSSGHGSLKILADEGDPAYQHVEPSERVTPMQSEDNSALARKWMEDCCQTHEKCDRPEAGVAPTRLLEINEDTVRLRASIPGETVSWAALSYCWGGPQPIQTTTATLAQNIDGILISLLPKTIQDAITTTRELGLRHLWVDCLCIIQDDVDDVRKEISLMPEIYRNSTVTISAARARTSREGFLHDVKRPTPQDISFRLRFLCPDGRIGSLVFYGQDEILPHRDPIEDRAWTLQEHLLSQRLLVFGSHQLWWTCRKVHTNLGRGMYFSTYSEIGEIRLRFLNVFLTQRRRYIANIPGQTWLSLVQHYTNRSLTFSYDKLLAISGIAEFYARKMDDEYLAGHFKASLLSSLLWKRHSPILPRPAEYRVPSWSWAAIDGQVRFELYRAPISDDLKLLECKIGLVSEDAPCGAVSSGILTLRGRLRQVLWNEARDTLIDPFPTSGEAHTFFAETIPDAVTNHSTSNATPSEVHCLGICTYTPTPLWRRSLPGQEDVVFGQKRTYQRSGLPKGLLLESKGGETFRRVGIFAFRDVEDLPVENERRLDEGFKCEVEREKREFFEGVEGRLVRII